MKARRFALFLGLVIATPWAGAAVEVEFVEPQKYSDAELDRYGESGRQQTLNELRRHFATLGQKCLKADQTLTIRVLDIDLAGHLEWSRRRATELRVLRQASWPALRLSWSLADGQGAASVPREERIADMAYLSHRPILSDSTSLPYEKAMLSTWFEQRFCPNESARQN